MEKTPDGTLKVVEDALAEAAAARANADGVKAEGERKSGALISVATALPVRPRGPIHYPQLTRTNYTLWAMQMRVAMQSAGVWEAVSFEKVTFDTDRDALLVIYQSVPEDVLMSLSGKDTANAAWDAIKTVHVGHDRVHESNLQALRKLFEGLEMGDSEPTEAFATRANKPVTSIRALGDDMKELTVVQKILQAVCRLEKRIKQRFGDPLDGQHLMLTRKQWGGYTDKMNFGGRGAVSGVKGGDDQPSSSKHVSDPKKKFKCYNYGVRGHFSKECKEPKNKKQGKALVVEKQDNEPAL